MQLFHQKKCHPSTALQEHRRYMLVFVLPEQSVIVLKKYDKAEWLWDESQSNIRYHVELRFYSNMVATYSVACNGFIRAFTLKTSGNTVEGRAEKAKQPAEGR